MWKEMYEKALEAQKPKTIGRFIEVGGVSSAILTDSGNIYIGVCIDTACSLGMCAERNAISTMITSGDEKIVKLLCITTSGKLGYPCGACLELIRQLDFNGGDVEVLLDINTLETVKVKDLLPKWWGNLK